MKNLYALSFFLTLTLFGNLYATPVYAGLTSTTSVSNNSGNIVTNGAAAISSRLNPASTITTGAATGSISACMGMASISPNIQQFTVSGSGLSANITASAPTGFEVSLSVGSGYGNSVILTPSAGTVNNTIIYVRSSASALAGNISGNVLLSSSGATSQNVAVSGIINALVTVNAVPNQTLANGAATTAINFTGTGSIFSWVNDTPGIGLAANGTGNIPSFTAINTGNSPVKATITATAIPSSAFAYITNRGSNNVSVISITTNTVIATIPVGTNPSGVTISPDGSRAYVANVGSGNVSVINTATNTVTATITTGSGSDGISVSPDGTRLYVANSNANTVSVINTMTDIVIATIGVGTAPNGVSVSPDGSRVYITNYNSKNVSVINAATNSVVATITVGSNPFGISMSPDGSKVYVANQSSYLVSVISTATNTVVSTITVGPDPYGVCVSRDGSLAYVADRSLGTVLVINTATSTVVSSITIGGAPCGVSISPDGSKLYVSNSGSGTVSVINTATNSVLSTITVGSSPLSFGNSTTTGLACSGPPVKFNITVNPTPTITAGTVTGIIYACAGTAALSPYIQQFAVSGNNLTTNITATAPTGLEVSLAAGSGYGGSVNITQTGGKVNGTIVYVRSAASAPAGNISANVSLTSTGAITRNAAVNSTVIALPALNSIANQTTANGETAAAINLTGTTNTFYWVNDAPGIGLAASGKGSIPSFTAINTSSSPVTATITVTPEPAEYAYILNRTDNTVSVINTATNLVVSTIKVGMTPVRVTISPFGDKVYVVNSGSNNVSVINTATNTVVATVPVGNTPVGVVVSPDGSKLYVVNINNTTISIINTATNLVVSTIPSSINAADLCISSDGSKLYVTDNDGLLRVINTTTNAVITTISGGSGPTITISPDGSRIYVTNGNNVLAINTATNTVVATIAVEQAPLGLAVSPDGSRLYVANSLSNGGISVINTSTNTVISTIIAGGVDGVSFSPDGNQLYATNYYDGTVSVINTATNKITATIPVGQGPASIGKFISGGTGCSGIPVVFTIKVDPKSVIKTGTVVGGISACAGTASVYPQIQQFTVSGSGLTADITVTAPTGFEVSLAPGSGYGNSLTITKSGPIVNSTVVYVRSAASAQSGNISGNIVLTSAGATSQNVTVAGTVNALLTVDPVPNMASVNGMAISAINFTGTTNNFNWVNDTPAIGLPASGTGNIPSFTTVNNNTGSSPVTATVTVTPMPPVGFAYIANNYSNTVSVINTSTNMVMTTIPVGFMPYATALSTDGSRVYVTNTSSNSVSVIKTSTNTVIATIAVGAGAYPNGVAVSPDGGSVYVTNKNSNTVSVINTVTNTVTATINVGFTPKGICISPDGTQVYVVNTYSNSVTVINAATNAVAATIPVANNPAGVSISPDGSRLYVTNENSNSVSVINTATNAVVATIAVQSYPQGISVSSDGKKVYVANEFSNTVSVIDAATNTVLSSINVGQSPIGVSVSIDSKLLYVPNSLDGNVTVINTATNAVISTIPVGSAPVSFGNFISGSTGCSGSPVKFAITINKSDLILPPTNFKLTITSATCKGSSDGSVNITAEQNLNYTATITGNGLNKPYPFTTTTDIGNLAAGTYNVCITISGVSNYQQCYSVVITEPKDLSVYSTINNKDNSINLVLSGGTQYNINLNGTLYTTTNNSITLPLAKGNNDLSITTERLCQGTVQKLINISGVIIPYPDPFENTLNVNLGNAAINNVSVEIRGAVDGKLVYSRQFVSKSGVLQLDMTNLNPGVYALYVNMDNTEKIFKIIKQ